jgi:hypothetical protein
MNMTKIKQLRINAIAKGMKLSPKNWRKDFDSHCVFIRFSLRLRLEAPIFGALRFFLRSYRIGNQNRSLCLGNRTEN